MQEREAHRNKGLMRRCQGSEWETDFKTCIVGLAVVGCTGARGL